jgi:hypothetical protein
MIVVLLLLASLALIGGSPGNSGGGSIGVAFSNARDTAAESAPLTGAWSLAGALGLDLTNATTLPINVNSNPNCTVTSFSGPLPSSLTIPAFTGNLSGGDAAEWLLAYVQASTGYETAVAVTDGVANLAVEISGAAPDCTVANATASGIPGSAVDSPAAASAVAGDGGAAFLQAHPKGVSLEMALISGAFGFPLTNEWLFAYSTCPLSLSSSVPPPVGPPGVTFTAAVNASSGEVVPHSAANGTCNGPPPLGIGSALRFGFASLIQGTGTGGSLESQGCTSGDYCYSIPIANASENVTPEDFEVEVTGPTGTVFPAVGYAILNSSGEVVVFAYGAVEDGWTAGVGNATTLLTNSMTLSVDMGAANPAGGNYGLTLTGAGPFANSGMGFGLP